MKTSNRGTQPKPTAEAPTDLQAKANAELATSIQSDLGAVDPPAATAASLLREWSKPDPLYVIEEMFKDPGVGAELARAGVTVPANSSAQEKLTALTSQRHILPKLILLKLIATHVFHH